MHHQLDHLDHPSVETKQKLNHPLNLKRGTYQYVKKQDWKSINTEETNSYLFLQAINIHTLQKGMQKDCRKECHEA